MQNIKKWLWVLFIAKIYFPMNQVTIKNIQSIDASHPDIYELQLVNGKKVLVPRMWTVIEEDK